MMHLSPREVVQSMGPHHPVTRSVIVLRAWLGLVIVMLVWNGFVANAILLEGWMRPLPFFSLAVTTAIWAWCPWRAWAVILGASTVGVGLWMRAAEVFFFAGDRYSLSTRFTGSSAWLTIGGTSILIGVLNLIVTSRRTAEEWVWKRKQ